MRVVELSIEIGWNVSNKAFYLYFASYIFTVKIERQLYCIFAKFIWHSIQSNCPLPLCGPNEKNPFLTSTFHRDPDVTMEMK